MNIPNEIVLELTSECNMNCAFCFNPPKKKNMEINKIKKIIDDVSSSSIKAIRYTGGEVFLRDDLKDILSYSKSKGIYNIINTNGLLIKTPNIFDFIDLTLISFHDISKFDIIKEKLKIINKDVMLCTIMTEDNILNLDKYYECISKINSPFFKEWFLLRPVPNPKYKFPIKDKDLLFLFKEIKRLNEKFDMNIMIANSVPFCSIEKDISRYCKGGVFDSGHSRLYIDSSGKYRTDYFSKDIGDVETKKVLDIWGKTEPIRRYENLKKECFSCFYLEKCKGGLGKTDYLVDRKNIIPLISIIVPAFNDSKRLSLLVESLKEQSFSDFEVIIVDDGSNEKERLENKKIVENLDNDWISYYYLQNAKVFGASIARNYGAKKAKGRILIFLDQDCVAHKDLIKNHVDEQKAKDIILGYFAGYGSKKGHYSFEKLYEKIMQKKEIKTILPEFRENIFIDQKEYSKSLWKFFASGNFSIKKEVFMDFMFDEDFLMWGAEDIELGYRISKKYSVFLSKKCLAYNSSDKKMIDRNKFSSLMKSLIQLYDKYETEELKYYCFERFDNVPLSIRKNSELIEIKSKNEQKLVFNEGIFRSFFRIDDVYSKCDELVDIMDLLLSKKIPVNLQVVPNRIDKETVFYLKELKKKFPRLISFNMHGYSHMNHSGEKSSYKKYEFGTKRTYQEQNNDILDGLDIMRNLFGKEFNYVFTPPYHGYNDDTIKILEGKGFKMVSLFEGHNIKNERLHIFNMNLDIVKNYDTNEYFTIEEMNNLLEDTYNNKQYMGVLLHPNFFSKQGKKLLEKIIEFILSKKMRLSLIEYEIIDTCN